MEAKRRRINRFFFSSCPCLPQGLMSKPCSFNKSRSKVNKCEKSDEVGVFDFHEQLCRQRFVKMRTEFLLFVLAFKCETLLIESANDLKADKRSSCQQTSSPPTSGDLWENTVTLFLRGGVHMMASSLRSRGRRGATWVKI